MARVFLLLTLNRIESGMCLWSRRLKWSFLYWSENGGSGFFGGSGGFLIGFLSDWLVGAIEFQLVLRIERKRSSPNKATERRTKSVKNRGERFNLLSTIPRDKDWLHTRLFCGPGSCVHQRPTSHRPDLRGSATIAQLIPEKFHSLPKSNYTKNWLAKTFFSFFFYFTGKVTKWKSKKKPAIWKKIFCDARHLF